MYRGTKQTAEWLQDNLGARAVGVVMRAEHSCMTLRGAQANGSSTGHRVRVEHWASALHQPRVAAASLLGGEQQYTKLPYFFTDQYELGMEYVGYAPNGSYDRVVVRGDLDDRRFIAFWLDSSRRIKAAMNVNIWDVVEPIERLIVARTQVDPERLTDSTVDLDSVTSGG